jgi:hypothetical protein
MVDLRYIGEAQTLNLSRNIWRIPIKRTIYIKISAKDTILIPSWETRMHVL